MNWSPQQEHALSAVADWLHHGQEPVFRLFGFAGTGKTTLAQHLAEDVGGEVLFGAFTGKAASVMRAKGCPSAMTIHQMIYQVTEKSTKRLSKLLEELQQAEVEDESEEVMNKIAAQIKAERERLKQPMFTVNPEAPARDAALIVIDECSMVNERMGYDLLSFGAPVLVLGDPAQLPPIFGCGFFTKHKPDILLTEIHRQARDNPIIKLATQVREGKTLEYGKYGSSVVTRKADANDALGVNQILVGMNRTRQRCISRVRELEGVADSPYPLPDERVVCLRNDHEYGLLNGTIWRVDDSKVVDDLDQISMTIRPDDGSGSESINVIAHKHHFDGRGDDLCPWTRRSAQEFDFGYALTVHKAQGSQWDSVLVYDESAVFKSSSRKWLYTAITRAAKSVIIVRR